MIGTPEAVARLPGHEQHHTQDFLAEDLIFSLGLRDYRADLIGRESRRPLILDLQKIREVMVPLHRINLLALVVDH